MCSREFFFLKVSSIVFFSFIFSLSVEKERERESTSRSPLILASLESLHSTTSNDVALEPRAGKHGTVDGGKGNGNGGNGGKCDVDDGDKGGDGNCS